MGAAHSLRESHDESLHRPTTDSWCGAMWQCYPSNIRRSGFGHEGGHKSYNSYADLVGPTKDGEAFQQDLPAEGEVSDEGGSMQDYIGQYLGVVYPEHRDVRCEILKELAAA